jgi:hypothetical protein
MIFVAYGRLYTQALFDALASMVKNLWTLLLPMALVLALSLLGSLLAPLGIVGGLLSSLARTAACSIYTFVLAAVVAKNRVSVSDLKSSIGAYFWSWMNLFFALWVLDFMLSGIV